MPVPVRACVRAPALVRSQLQRRHDVRATSPHARRAHQHPTRTLQSSSPPHTHTHMRCPCPAAQPARSSASLPCGASCSALACESRAARLPWEPAGQPASPPARQPTFRGLCWCRPALGDKPLQPQPRAHPSHVLTHTNLPHPPSLPRSSSGGDYPLSAVITSEYTPRNMRGAMMAAVFSMQGIGFLAASLTAVVVVSGFKSAIESVRGRPLPPRARGLLVAPACADRVERRRRSGKARAPSNVSTCPAVPPNIPRAVRPWHALRRPRPRVARDCGGRRGPGHPDLLPAHAPARDPPVHRARREGARACAFACGLDAGRLCAGVYCHTKAICVCERHASVRAGKHTATARVRGMQDPRTRTQITHALSTHAGHGQGRGRHGVCVQQHRRLPQAREARDQGRG